MAAEDTTTRLFNVQWADEEAGEPVMPEEEEDEEEEGGEEQHWASPSSTQHRMVLCDVDVRYKPPRAFLFRSHGFFHQVALTSINTLSRLGQGEYELELRQCEGYRPSPRFLRFHVAASSPSTTTTSSSSPSIGSGEPLYVGTITMHELRFQFLRSLVPGVSTLVAMAIALVFGLRALQRRQSTQQNEKEMKPSSSSTTSRAGSPIALSSSALSSSFSSSSSSLPLKTNGELSLEEESTAVLAGDNLLPLVQLPENEAGWKDLFEKVYSSPTSDDGEESLAGFGLSPPQPQQEQQQGQGQGPSNHQHQHQHQEQHQHQHQQGEGGEEQQMLRRSPLTPCTPSSLRTTDRPLARPPSPGSAFSISSSSPASAFALVDSPSRGVGEGGQEGGLEGGGGEEEVGGQGLGWVNEYWSLGGSGSNKRLSMRDEGEESPTMLEKEEEQVEEEGEEGNNVLEQEEEEEGEEEEEEDEQGTGERDGDFPSKQEEEGDG